MWTCFNIFQSFFFIDCNVCFTKVVGKCYLSYSENVGSLEEIEKWSAKGPDRFYFADAYDLKTNELVDVPRSGCEVGYSSKNKGKSKSKNTRVYSKPIDYPTLNKKLRTLDVFAGCGGIFTRLKLYKKSSNYLVSATYFTYISIRIFQVCLQAWKKLESQKLNGQLNATLRQPVLTN